MLVVRFSILILLLTFVAGVCSAQRVRADDKVLRDIPEAARKTLAPRLEAYLTAFNRRDLSALYDLLSARAKGGFTRAEFAKNAIIEDERILTYRILEVSKSEVDDFVGGNPPPRADEGERWSISGCSKVSIKQAKPEKFKLHYHVWLVNGQWYVQHGGRINGDERCD